MKLWRHSILCVFLFIGLSACYSSRNSVQQSNIQFTILQLNDVYEIAPLEGGKAGGLARVATVLKELEGENPNTIAVIAGDFLSPSLMATLKMDDGERIAGLQMVEALNAMGMDYATFGNHEFDISSLETLQKRIDQSDFQYTVCNAQMKKGTEQSPFVQKRNGQMEEVPTYIIHEFKNNNGQSVRLAMVGVVLPFTSQDYLAYLPVEETFQQTVDEVKDKADVIIGITHLAIEEDMALAKKLTDVPLLIGGHDHVNMRHKVGETVITKADANAKTVYIHRVSYNPNSKETSIKSELKTIDDQIADEPATKAVIDKWTNKVNEIFTAGGYEPNRKLMIANKPLECKEVDVRSRQTNYGALTTAAMANTIPGADVYFINSGSMRMDDDISGTVVEYDVLRTFPFGGAVVSMELDGKTLNQVLNMGLVKNKTAGGYFQIADVKGEENNWMINGKSIDSSQKYKVVLPQYVAEGREANLEILGQFTFEESPEFSLDGKVVKNDIRNIVIAYMEKIKKN